MKSELPILDAEFVDLPITKPETALGRAKGKAPRAKPIRQTKTARRANPEGRVDVLAGGMLTQYYGQMVGSPAPAPIAESIQKAATMIFGKQRAKGPEWEFIKSLMKG